MRALAVILLLGLLGTAARAVDLTTEINALANSSVAIAEKAGEMLSKMVPDIQKTAELVQEISAASREQNSGSEQINQAIQQLDNVIQQNAANAEENASASEQMSAQSEQMKSFVSDLVRVVSGGVNTGDTFSLKENIIRTIRSKASVPIGHGKNNRNKVLTKKISVRSVKPEQIIPLEDEELREF